MLYDYSCKDCKRRWEEFVWNKDEQVDCELCGKPAERQFPNDINIHSFPPEGITLEHLPGGPRTFKNRTEMRAYAKEKDVELGALL